MPNELGQSVMHGIIHRAFFGNAFQWLRFTGDCLKEKEMPSKICIMNCDLRAVAANLLAILSFFVIGSAPVSAGTQEETSRDFGECANIQDSEKRLACYDSIAEPKSNDIDPAMKSAKTVSKVKTKKVSYFSQLWELNEDTRSGKYAMKLHRPTWVLPISYNESPNIETIRDANPKKDVKKPEVVFQLSTKVKLWQDIFNRKADLWFGYTQRSFWQLYNFADSSPFRETNYEPELLLNFRTDYSLLGLKGNFINVGINHQSNGQSEPLSRSWNRVVLNFGFEKNRFSFLLKTWCRIPESAEEDDNPNIEKYLGYGELWAFHFQKKHRFGLMLRNNLNFHKNRGAVQVEWSFPLIFERLAGYLQYYVGYGESLMDYNHKTNRVGMGLILLDWN
jgi:phospholipase A1/A2